MTPRAARRERREMNRLRRAALVAAKGFCMGAADVVPGVSGGTMAFILGIYPQLLAAIKSFDLEWLRRLLTLDLRGALTYPHLRFLLPLVAGIAGALLFFTRVVPLPLLIHTRPELVYGLFFGLILGSIALLLRHIEHWTAGALAQLALGVIVGFFLVTLVPVSTPETPAFVFLSGALAICAMILPGISGSFILLILRKYAYIFEAVGHLDVGVLLPFGLGIVTGLALFSRLLTWLLSTCYRATLLAINGLLIASLWVIWPFQDRVYEIVRGKQRLIASTPLLPQQLDATTAGAFALMLVGIGVVLAIHRLAAHQGHRG